jgi:DNA-binding NtrC family response regulator
MKILLLLKDVHILRLYKEELEDDGYEICEAQSGIEALKKISEEKFDLVISDAFLPDIELPELIAKIKKISPETKTIATSSYHLIDINERVLRATDYFVSKKSDLAELKAIIAKIL